MQSAGAGELSLEAAAGGQSLSASVAGSGHGTGDQAAAAASSARDGSQVSRDTSRSAVASTVGLSEQKVAAAARAAAARAAAAKAAAARKARAKKAEAARKKAHRWVSPISNYTLTSGYGWRWGRMHPAQDLAAPIGTPVRALSTGTVIFAGWSNEGYGQFVKIRYWDGTVSWFAHNSRLLVSVGEQVKPGQVVSYSGSTGNSTGPHLHLEIHPHDGAPVSPRPWLTQKGVHL
ncbi:MAG: M23 family metallopeptidase [Intrasporangium sp.]|uniref:M23 family metallopeptidase n=1 Tax=Intrasporangium sp. TaxID=1925024 RepID=UPI002647BEAC|nr:M23 family metallopeptidase [Intrasporangium sp.]MDN5794528.1 M23 family metallopeptidase [Intrasporangium sp.]